MLDCVEECQELDGNPMLVEMISGRPVELRTKYLGLIITVTLNTVFNYRLHLYQ